MNNTLPHDPRPGTSPPLVWWAATIAWTITIYQFSTATYGVTLTAWLIGEILRILGIHLSAATFESVHFLVRKLAHVTEYGIFSALLYGSLGAGRDMKWVWRRAILCAAIAAGYSLTDELHQVFVPGRSASFLDSALDASGAILAMAAVYIFNRLTQTKAKTSAASAANPAET